jgi:DNA-binding CsgD family transcriptional regulator
VDADQLLRAQAEAVAASSVAIASVYLARDENDPGRWLEIGATELWRFAATRRLLTPPAAAWLILVDEPPDSAPHSLGLGLGGCLTDDHRRNFAARIQPLVRFFSGAPGGPSIANSPEPADLGIGGILQGSFEDRGGGKAIVLGGLLKTDGSLDSSVDEDPLIASMFAAIARAAGDCIIKPIALHRTMMARLSPAQQRVLVHLVEGLTTLEIGQRIDRSPHTVHDHVLAIYRTFGVNSRRALFDQWNGRAPLSLPDPPPTDDSAIDIQILAPVPEPRSQVQ